jgi:hypothetical protein
MFKMEKDVYDAIELVSEAEGGLRRSRMYDEDGRPCCMVGAAHFAGVIEAGTSQQLYSAAGRATILGLLPSYTKFDDAHQRLASDCDERLPWPLIAKEMGVVRGDA